jgi:hypothetical protein
MERDGHPAELAETSSPSRNRETCRDGPSAGAAAFNPRDAGSIPVRPIRLAKPFSASARALKPQRSKLGVPCAISLTASPRSPTWLKPLLAFSLLTVAGPLTRRPMPRRWRACRGARLRTGASSAPPAGARAPRGRRAPGRVLARLLIGRQRLGLLVAEQPAGLEDSLSERRVDLGRAARARGRDGPFQTPTAAIEPLGTQGQSRTIERTTRVGTSPMDR